MILQKVVCTEIGRECLVYIHQPLKLNHRVNGTMVSILALRIGELCRGLRLRQLERNAWLSLHSPVKLSASNCESADISKRGFSFSKSFGRFKRKKKERGKEYCKSCKSA